MASVETVQDESLSPRHNPLQARFPLPDTMTARLGVPTGGRKGSPLSDQKARQHLLEHF